MTPMTCRQWKKRQGLTLHYRELGTEYGYFGLEISLVVSVH
jgi:hypothetical protein